MKTKFKFYNRVYKEIKKGFLRVYFFLEIKLLRFLHFTFKAKIYKKKNKISLLCPTKNRSKKLTRFKGLRYVLNLQSSRTKETNPMGSGK